MDRFLRALRILGIAALAGIGAGFCYAPWAPSYGSQPLNIGIGVFLLVCAWYFRPSPSW